jgi:hypothetical protein
METYLLAMGELKRLLDRHAALHDMIHDVEVTDEMKTAACELISDHCEVELRDCLADAVEATAALDAAIEKAKAS